MSTADLLFENRACVLYMTTPLFKGWIGHVLGADKNEEVINSQDVSRGKVR